MKTTPISSAIAHPARTPLNPMCLPTKPRRESQRSVTLAVCCPVGPCRKPCKESIAEVRLISVGGQSSPPDCDTKFGIGFSGPRKNHRRTKHCGKCKGGSDAASVTLNDFARKRRILSGDPDANTMVPPEEWEGPAPPSRSRRRQPPSSQCKNTSRLCAEELQDNDWQNSPHTANSSTLTNW